MSYDAGRLLNDQRWFWVTLGLSSVTIAAAVFAAWELVENRFFRHLDYITLHYLYISRGIVSSLVLAFWAAWYVVRQRRRYEEDLRRSREHYRGLLEASPGAVALYDVSLKVAEWNAAAERLYGFSKEEVVGRRLPTVPPDGEGDLHGLLDQTMRGHPILDVEVTRRDKSGEVFDVQLSLLPYTAPNNELYFLEVATDIRQRTQLRTKLLAIEKLTTMGLMAGGTAHHLNTPLAAMLLRLQMMRGRYREPRLVSDLDLLESGTTFCQQFVQRLLQFSHPGPAQKRPVEVEPLLKGVLAFLAPTVNAKRVRVSSECNSVARHTVLADRNAIEAMLSVLLSNALDAVAPQGRILITCGDGPAQTVEIRVSDNGCGIPAEDMPHLFEPFFTTKPPGKGTGLGLAIAKNIAAEHQGSIEIESKPNAGTVTIVRLPVVLEPSRAAETTLI